MSEAAFEKMYQRRYARGHRFLNVDPTVQINNDTYSISFNFVQTQTLKKIFLSERYFFCQNKKSFLFERIAIYRIVITVN